jgi:hypothetical protein
MTGAISATQPWSYTMQTSLRPLSAALLLWASCSSFAQTDAVLPPRVEITAPAEAVAAARVIIERRDSDQRFQLPNGRSVEVDSFGETLQLRYRNRQLAARHDGQGAFVSGNGQLRVEFRLDAAGEPSTLHMAMPAAWY